MTSSHISGAPRLQAVPVHPERYPPARRTLASGRAVRPPSAWAAPPRPHAAEVSAAESGSSRARRAPGRRSNLDEDWVEVDGRLIRSFGVGRPTDLPEVVLVPGLGAPAYLFPWARELGRWTRVTVLDLPGWRRGRGRSSASTVAAVGAAAAGWLEVTDRRRVVLGGHSSGAQSALRTALAVPDRLAGLVLAGPTLDPRARHPAALLLRLVVTLAREKLPEVPAVLPWYVRSGGAGWVRLVRSVVRDRPEDLVAGLRGPLLVLTGDRDRFAPPAWAEHLATLASAPCVRLPGPHNACFTSPELAAAAVQRAVLGWTGR